MVNGSRNRVQCAFPVRLHCLIYNPLGPESLGSARDRWGLRHLRLVRGGSETPQTGQRWVRGQEGQSVMKHIAAIVAALSLTARAASNVKPEDVGLSSERLQRINEAVQRYIDSGQITGAVTVVARRGKVAHFEAQGLMDVESKTPMRRDAIFRIASMSKPVTGVAIMMLMEEGKLRLTDPVSRFIPDFKDMKVAVAKESKAPAAAAPGQAASAPEFYTVPAAREITIRDLLTHTSGLESGSLGNRIGARVAPRDVTKTVGDWVSHLPAVPLDFQPGSQWTYSPLAGMDTLGRIVEIVSGQPYDRFLKERLFDPLGMRDTSFAPSDDRKPRFVTLYNRSPRGLQRGETPAW